MLVEGSPASHSGQVARLHCCANLTRLTHAAKVLPLRGSRLVELVGIRARRDLGARYERRELAERGHEGM